MKSEKIRKIANIFEIPCSEPPGEALKQVFYQLRHPVNSLKGCLTILQMPFDEELKHDTIILAYEVAIEMEKLRVSAYNYLATCFESEADELGEETSISPRKDLERFINELKEPINAIKDSAGVLKESSDENEQLRAMLRIYRFVEEIEELRISISNELNLGLLK